MVDSINGNNTTASVGGSSFKTIEPAISAVNTAGSTGKTIYILPGTYDLSSGITIPSGASIRGMSVQTCTIQMLNVSADTTLVTMGENTRLEDVTLKLTSAQHHTLKGIVFGGTTSINAKLRTAVLTVDNSGSPTNGTSVVTGVEFNGTGTLTSSSFSFNSLKGSTINVYSNGNGNKRGVLVSGQNVTSTRDVNIYVAAPPIDASGSYVGVETADQSGLGSIQLRTTTIGSVRRTALQTFTSSDILQTNPTTITNPTYLASPGIQIGPGTDLVTKSAGGKGFSTYNYPNIIYYGLRGDIRAGANAGYLWPGTQSASSTFPDTGTPPAYFRLQQPALLSGLTCALNSADTDPAHTVTLLIRYTAISTGIVTDTPFTLTLSNTNVGSFYNASVSLNTGDRIHLYLTYTGGNGNMSHDLTAQIDLF